MFVQQKSASEEMYREIPTQVATKIMFRGRKINNGEMIGGAILFRRHYHAAIIDNGT
mgnify:CR=1 FL=1